MRHARIEQTKPERSFVERIVAVIVAIAMLGGMGYATTSAAMAEDAEQTLEQQAGISLGLHDYDRKTINNNHALKFMSVGESGTYNRYVGDSNGAYTGIVNKTLTTNGYPTMAADKGPEPLDYLFGGKPDDEAVTNYEPTGGLLALDKDGYYGFDADSRYAAYNTTSKKFELRDQNCGNDASTPCFTPFGNNNKDNKYSFGMNLGADFYMPKDGKVNNQDMVFDFTGDDDVWVFIDGVLVLDLGGIHQALGGSINFATGDITYDKTQSHGDTPARTIAQAFDEAGKTWDSTPYKTHHLSFFYLERGDGGSNCKIKFNLPVKPSKAIDIEKETLGTIDANKQFQFQLFVDGSKDSYQGKYSVYNAYTNQVQFDAQTDNNGVITLTKGQFARVQSDDFTDSTAYRVRELNSSGYTVSANGSPMTQQGSGDSAYAETGSFTVGTTGHVTIVNSNVKPSNNKSIVKTDGIVGDEYTLHLTASGDSTSSTVTTATPADIVLVMDKSGSMEGERDSNAKKAANALAGKLLTSQNSALPESQRVRMAVVTFSTNASLKQNFTTDVSEINNAVKGNPKGGTNWEAALKQANDLQGRSGVKKHIIFLSDGNPTYRTSSYGGSCYSYSYSWGGHYTPQPEYTTKATCKAAGYYWRGENPDGGSDDVYGAGDSDDYGFNYAAALAEANKRGDAALYVVKTSTDANKMTDLAREANAVNGEEFDGTNAENLTKAFDQIYSSITSSAKIKVFSITDTLSQWVDPVDFVGTGDVTKSVTVKNGSTVLTSGYAATYSVDSSGNRTVTVTFNGTDGTDGMVAEKTDVIDVSFKVKPRDAAYADYASNNNYPNTGDANTGDVSAGKQGYYSNADAKLNYCVLTEVNGATSCVRTEAEYPHPVVQVKLGKINITKQWSDGAGKHTRDSVTVQLQRKVIGATNAENVGNPITLNAANNWTTTVDNLVPGYTYSVVETIGDDRYDVTYTGNNTELTKKMVWSSNADAGTLKATITNTLKTVSLQHLISVQKNLTGREWKDSDQFGFTLEAEDNAPLPSSCKDQQPCTVTVERNSTDHSAAFGDITYNAGDATYTYYVTENSGSISALHYSQARYKVVVTVAKNNDGAWTASVTSVTKVQDDNGQKVSESQSVSTPVAFTNHYIAVSALPLTGGMTDRQWLFVGGVVGGLAVLLIGAAGVWNGKKRLV
ncbi:VWA domain-containing protein [Bifidobacterium catenulatum]|nr:VWA domain-containing protein [Bifidobacterium catenulatum]KAB7465197.1 VWA domain-containing protein [Bifidobacterium catenulatum]